MKEGIDEGVAKSNDDALVVGCNGKGAFSYNIRAILS